MPTPYWNKIEKYWYFWFVENPGGRLFVRFQGIIDTIRNEKPCYWNVTYTSIGPFWEDVGEAEG